MRRASALLLAAALLAGCSGGSGKKARREAVNAYITQVDLAAAVLTNERQTIDATLRRLSTASSTAAEVARLRRIATEIHSVARKVEALHPPAEAATLHTEFLELLELEAIVAAHLARSAGFVPKLNRTLARSRPADARLARELKSAKTWQADAQAYAHYQGVLAAIVARLADLTPPPEMKPTVASRLQRLRMRTQLAGALASAFAKQDANGVSEGLRRLGVLSAQVETDAEYRERVAMVKSYNRRLSRIATLAAKIAQERQRLVEELG